MGSRCFPEKLNAFGLATASPAFDGYLPRPIPSELDQQVSDFLSEYLDAPGFERDIGGLSNRAASVLLAFGERSSARAVREQSPALLDLAVRALGLAATIVADIREVLLVLPLPWHSAHLLKLDPKACFIRASLCLPPAGKQVLVEFCERERELQTLACMGYAEGSDSDGYRYVRNW